MLLGRATDAYLSLYIYWIKSPRTSLGLDCVIITYLREAFHVSRFWYLLVSDCLPLLQDR